MMKFTKMMKNNDDASLVLLSIGGDREAFCAIVEKYQNLICSVAFASVGDIKISEDIAQDTFVEAWQKLDSLREPEKLKSWLCGIVRFKVSGYLRKEAKQPLRNAVDFQSGVNQPAGGKQLEDAAMDGQQSNLLWDTLSTIDITYREPLVLFYRQEQSVEQVAAELDLTVDTAKQRLSRGRKLLKKSMDKLLENVLEKSKPGAIFTAAVFAMLEDVSKEAAASALGIGAVKSSSFFKLPGVLAGLASISGLISSFFGLKASLYQSRTDNEKRLVYKVVGLFLSIVLGFVLMMYGMIISAHSHPDYVDVLSIASQVTVLAFIVTYLLLTFKAFAAMEKLRAHERIFNPQAFARDIDSKHSENRQYISKWKLFGVPLMHFQLSTAEKSDKPVIAWIAGGSKAYGLLFAWGGIAVAPISVGTISVGVITCGAVGFGILSTGAVAVGAIAFGASAVGYKAFASLSSLGWESAFSNGFSIAREAAVGPFAFANEVNNDMAYNIASLTLFGQSYQWILGLIAVVVILPSYLHYKHVKSRNS